MADLKFEWDQGKNRANIKKHNVSFEGAETLFKDDNAVQYFDPDHLCPKGRQIRKSDLLGDKSMRDHYDFSKMKGKKNPFLKYLKQPTTIRLDKDVVTYFKSMSAKTGIPYQNLINFNLRDCAEHGRELRMRWVS